MSTLEDTLEDEASLRTGRAVKQQREACGFSLRKLAEKSGISSSMISDIERGTKSPTVITLVRLAQAMGITAAALVDGGEGPAPRIRVQRRGEGTGGDTPARWKTVVPGIPGSHIDFVHYQVPPSTILGPTAGHAPGTVEHMYVTAGTVRMTVGDEMVEIAAGDSCSCRTDVTHVIENPDPTAWAQFYLILERR